MTSSQKKITLVVAVIGLLYFSLFYFPNHLGAETQSMFEATSIDEPITYPYVLRMLQDPASLKELFVRWVVYGDYHYGWIFYLWSALVILPTKIFYGMGFINHLQLNLLLLRQFVSVLPMVLAISGLVYLQTRFKSWIKTLLLLVFLLTIRSVFRINIQFWHPDSLSILALVITLFFLDRDHLRFGRNFYFAAAACGVAIGIKLAGTFFFLTIATYLLAGYIKHILDLKKMLIKGAVFIMIMLGSLFITNPFLYNQGAREDLIKIQTYKSQQLSSALDYPQEYSINYTKSPYYWDWTLRTWFSTWPFLTFLFISLLIGCFWGPNKFLNRLILTFIVPYTLYVFYFVAPKPDTYMLPAMIPLFSSMLALPDAIKEILAKKVAWRPSKTKAIMTLVTLAVYVLLAGQVVSNITRFYSGNYPQYTTALNIEESAQ
jgi:hypothetical protein